MVDDFCNAVGVTKGGFFHHFGSKENLAVAAANPWSETMAGFFAEAPYHQAVDPLDRVFGYKDFRKAILQGELLEFTCLVVAMMQETYDSNRAIRKQPTCRPTRQYLTLHP